MTFDPAQHTFDVVVMTGPTEGTVVARIQVDRSYDDALTVAREVLGNAHPIQEVVEGPPGTDLLIKQL